jgi:hypothetical protein
MTAPQAPASAGQRLLWLLDRYRGHGGALNCPMACRITGSLDIDALPAAIDYLTYRHESLRTTFLGRGPNLTQRINESRPVRLTGADLSTADDPAQALAASMAAEFRTRIDPADWPSRVTLWKTGAAEHVLCLNLTHLVTDSWSCAVLFRELGPVLARCLGEAAPLPEVGWQYREFTRWQEDMLAGERGRELSGYWLGQLSGLRLAAIPLRSRGGDLEGTRRSEQASISPVVFDGLRRLARDHQTTLFTVMFAVFVALLARVTGQNDIAVGSMFANRTQRQTQRTVGFLANLLMLRVRLPASPSFDDVISACHDTVTGALAHQDLPYHLLPTDRTAQPVRADDLVFQMLAEPIDQVTRTAGLEFAGIVPDVVGRFDVEFSLMPRDDDCAAKLYFTPERLDPGWARDFITSYVALAADFAS